MDAMIKTVVDADTLQAFVDGALSPEEAARVVLTLADSPQDQAYVDALMETNALLAAAYADPMHQALPERLRATIFPEQAAPPAPAPRRTGWRRVAAVPRARMLGALAACAVAAAGVGAALLPASGGGDAGEVVSGQLASVLDGEFSYMPVVGADGSEMMVNASYLDSQARPCREYEIMRRDAGTMTEGIACRSADAAWDVEIVVASRLVDPDAPRDGFVPASGVGDGPGEEALEAVKLRLGMGAELTSEEEAARIADGWSY